MCCSKIEGEANVPQTNSIKVFFKPWKRSPATGRIFSSFYFQVWFCAKTQNHEAGLKFPRNVGETFWPVGGRSTRDTRQGLIAGVCAIEIA